MKKIFFSLAVFTAFVLVGCGGGGGSSSAPSGNLFPTNAVAAVPNSANGEKLSDNIKNNNSSSTLNSVDSDSGVNTGLMSNITKKLIEKNLDVNNNFLNAVGNPENCEDGGTVTFSGTDNGNIIDTTATFANCKEDGVISNGSVHAIINFTDNTQNTLTSFSISLPSNLTFSGVYNLTMYKGSSMSMTDFSGNDYTMTINVRGKTTGEDFGSQNSVWRVTDGITTSMYQTAGKEYLTNMSEYVTYDSSYDMSATPLVFNANGDLTSGTARYLADGNNSIQVKVTADNVLTISVDTNGDGSYDSNTTKQYH